MKNWYTSKTVWSGIAKIVAGLTTGGITLAQCIAEAGVFACASQIELFIGGLGLAVWGVIDIFIRFKTNQSIK